MTEMMRTFEGGATRHSDEGKLDYEGFLSPWALEAYARYLDSHRVQADGKLRASDNWQKGIPLDVYMKSEWRHFHEQWKLHRQDDMDTAAMIEAICGVLFNAFGYLHELTVPAIVAGPADAESRDSDGEEVRRVEWAVSLPPVPSAAGRVEGVAVDLLAAWQGVPPTTSELASWVRDRLGWDEYAYGEVLDVIQAAEYRPKSYLGSRWEPGDGPGNPGRWKTGNLSA